MNQNTDKVNQNTDKNTDKNTQDLGIRITALTKMIARLEDKFTELPSKEYIDKVLATTVDEKVKAMSEKMKRDLDKEIESVKTEINNTVVTETAKTNDALEDVKSELVETKEVVEQLRSEASDRDVTIESMKQQLESERQAKSELQALTSDHLRYRMKICEMNVNEGEQASQLYGKFLLLDGNEHAFKSWLHGATGANVREQNDCYQSMNGYYQNFHK